MAAGKTADDIAFRTGQGGRSLSEGTQQVRTAIGTMRLLGPTPFQQFALDNVLLVRQTRQQQILFARNLAGFLANGTFRHHDTARSALAARRVARPLIAHRTHRLLHRDPLEAAAIKAAACLLPVHYFAFARFPHLGISYNYKGCARDSTRMPFL